MNTGITDLLKKYGTSLEDTRALAKELRPAIDERRRQSETPFLNTPQFFSAEDVAGLGLVTTGGAPFTLDEGWQLKITPGVNGNEPSFALIDPEGWEILQDQSVVDPRGNAYTAEEAAGLEHFAPAAQTLPTVYNKATGEVSEWQLLTPADRQLLQETFAELETFTDEDWDNWYDTLIQEGKTPENTFILSALGASLEEIDALFAAPPTAITPASMTPKTLEERTLLLTSFYGELKPETLDSFFELDGTPESVRTWATEHIKELGLDTTFGVEHAVAEQESLLIKFQTGIFPPPNLVGKAALSFNAGIADLFSSAGGAATWLGLDDLGERLNSSAGRMLVQYESRMPLRVDEDFEWSELLDPDFYATQVARTIPFCLSLLPMAVGGFVAGSAAAGAIGLGRIGTWLAGTFVGTALSRPAESLFEAGEAYNLAVAMGKTPEEAGEAAHSVFVENLTLAGLDAIEIGIAFAPTPNWVPKRLISMGLVRTMTVAGKVVIVGLSEGGEEIYQDIIQRRARGEEWHWDAISKEVFAIGAIMGMGMGLGGDIVTHITDHVEENLPPPQRQIFDDRVSALKEEGVPEQAAELQAIEELIATDPVASDTVKAAIAATAEEEEQREAFEMQEELAGIQEWLMTEQATRLISLIKRTREFQGGEVGNLTIKQYVALVGKQPLPISLTPDMRHVNWEAALDDLAPEYGYTNAQDLKDAIERVNEARQRAKYLEGAIPEIKPKEAPAPPIIDQLRTLYGDIQTEITAAQAAIKGLTGEEAKLSRQTLAGLERELKYIGNTLESFKQREGLPDATVLRSTIMAAANLKGLSKEQLQNIFSEVAGRRQLRVITQENLVKILDRVKAARPRSIRGKRVITLKTEKKIATLKDTLIRNKQLTEKSFAHLMEQFGLRTSRYESQYRFITESEGLALIRAMNDEAVLAQWDIAVDEALNKHPDIRVARDKLNTRSNKTAEVTFEGKPIKIRRGNELRSMRYYVLRLQKELGVPIYDIWQKINMAHLAMRAKEQILINKLTMSTEKFKAIARNESSLKRVEDYIASKHKMGPPLPTNITADEIALANELERQLFAFRNDVRYARFTEAYSGHSGNIEGIVADIPDAPRRALRRAMDIYEGRGATALREFLDTQEWGVIRSGYNPLSIVKPKLHLYQAKATSFAQGHIQTRRGIEFTVQDRNILSRYRSYTKQMMALTDLSPLVRAFDRVFTENAYKLDNYRPVANVLSRGLNEMKGYREDGGFIVHMLERMYAQVASAVFWRPDLVLRNKFQNFAFNPDYHMGLFANLQNRFMSQGRRAWFEVFVVQQKGIEQDYLLYSQKPMPGFGLLTDLAHRTSLYPWSDKSNRAEAFFVRMNRIDRALTAYRENGKLDDLISNSGLRDFEARQQAEALELLAMDRVDYGIEGMPAVSGEEAFARYNAQQLVNNVHFLYDRAQRAPAEMGSTGKTLGNILVFSRSWGERIVLQASKLVDPKVSVGEKFTAMRIVVGIIVAGIIAGEVYKRITGKDHNPYNPLNILSWTPGGLIVGAAEDISETIYWITEAAQGNDTAMGKLPGLISGCADICLPFYKNAIQAIDALTDKKDWDILAMRRIREMIDAEYELQGGVHEVERTLLEALQHALLAGKDVPATTEEKLNNAEAQLGLPIPEMAEPFSVEDPETYDMKEFGQDINSFTSGMTPDQVTKDKGYSALVVAYVLMREQRAIYNAFSDKTSKSYIKDDGERSEARTKWLTEHPEANAMMAVWGIAGVDFETREAWDLAQQMFKDLNVPEDAIPESNVPANAVDSYFKYMEAVAEFGANSAEARAIRAADPAFQAWGETAKGWQPIDTPVEELELAIKWREQDDAYDALTTIDERNAYLDTNPDYAIARLERDAYGYGFPETMVSDYVEYYSLPGKADNDFYTEHPNEPLYEDDWFLIEHPEFYQAARTAKGWQPRDFSKVPTRAVWELYQEWMDTPKGAERRAYEAANPTLDYWLHIVKGTKLENDLGDAWLEANKAEIFAFIE